jgi:hypothetical protein
MSPSSCARARTALASGSARRSGSCGTCVSDCITSSQQQTHPTTLPDPRSHHNHDPPPPPHTHTHPGSSSSRRGAASPPSSSSTRSTAWPPCAPPSRTRFTPPSSPPSSRSWTGSTTAGRSSSSVRKSPPNSHYSPLPLLSLSHTHTHTHTHPHLPRPQTRRDEPPRRRGPGLTAARALRPRAGLHPPRRGRAPADLGHPHAQLEPALGPGLQDGAGGADGACGCVGVSVCVCAGAAGSGSEPKAKPD